LEEIPKGYEVRRSRFPENPVLRAMRDGANSIDLNGSELFKPKKSENLEHYYECLENKVDLAKDPNFLLSYWALFAPMRQYVIEKIKAPLQKAIENAKTLSDVSKELFSAVKKIPLITKKNTCFLNTHILIDKRDEFLTYHLKTAPKYKMTEAAFNIDIFEYEHDGYYAFLQDWLLIELAMELAKGNWLPRFSKFPLKGYWCGPDLPDIETIRKKMREALE